jgi:hypothetical protein
VLTALCAGGEHSVAAALCGALTALCGPPPAAPLPPPSAAGAPRLGLPGVPLARAVAALTRCGWSAPASTAATAGAFPALLCALPAFPWHSILHRVVAAAAVDALALAAPHVVSPLFLEARLLDRMVGGLRGCGSPPTHGFSGHLHAVANAVLCAVERGALSPQVAAHVAAHAAFWALVDGELATANVASGVLLGGKLPPDSKSTGQVGVNADAMPAPGTLKRGAAATAAAAAAAAKRLGAVDGFAPEEEGDGGAGSFSGGGGRNPSPRMKVEEKGGDQEEEEEEEDEARGWDGEDRGLIGGGPKLGGVFEEADDGEKEAGKEGEEFERAPPEEADAEFATLADDEFDAFGDGDSSMARLPPVEASIGFDDPFSFDEPAAAPPPAVPAAVDDSWGAF